MTGACGRVGTALVEHLHDSYDFEYFDKVDKLPYQVHTGDIADYPTVDSVMEGVDSVVHLAADPHVDASWPSVLQSNIIGSYNVFEAARRREVESLVFASTNHVVGMYEQDRSPELYELHSDFLITKETPVRPDSHYATAKVCNEGHARYYVENYDYPKRVYVIRLGSIRYPEDDHPYADAERGVEGGEWARDSDEYRQEVKRMKGTWQSRRDVAAQVDACLSDDSVTYDVFFGVSDNDRGWLDIEHAKEQIGYDPQDNGEDWDGPPTDS